MPHKHAPERLAGLNVSRETIRRLEIHEDMLLKWRSVKNLIGPATFQEVWTRHFADSLQLRRLEPSALTWVDIGSGAGFPGLVIAAELADTQGAMVHLVESDQRRCAFLREAARAMGVNVVVHSNRAEDVISRFTDVNVVTARAVAPLHKLVDLALPLLATGAKGLFPKGRGYAAELTALKPPDSLDIGIQPSLTDPAAAVITVNMRLGRSVTEIQGV